MDVMTNAATSYYDDNDEYLNLNLRLVYMVDDFYELMIMALLNPEQSGNGSASQE